MGIIFDCCCPPNSNDREVKLLYHVNKLERKVRALEQKNSLLKREIYDVSRITPRGKLTSFNEKDYSTY